VNLKSYEILPNNEIVEKDKVTQAFLNIGIHDIHSACEYISKLPYGRTSEKSNYMLVLAERRGTCSTKHALIAALAWALKVNVQLTLGIYLMRESNTPGIGKILTNSGFDFLPEAHCYLKYLDERIDLTGLIGNHMQIDEFLHEEKIESFQIGDYKKTIHQNFIKQWMPENRFEEIWALREKYIESISK
jgi:hypothetical protein